MTVHRKSLAEYLQNTAGLSSSQADFFIRDFFDIISEELAQGNDVKLSGFGNFVLRHKNSRPGRNVATNEVVTVLPRRVVSFKAGIKLKSRVKSGTEELKKTLGTV